MKLALNGALNHTRDRLWSEKRKSQLSLKRDFLVKGPEKPNFGKGTQLIVSLGDTSLQTSH